MIKNLIRKFINILSYVPLIKFVLRFIYIHSIKKIKKQYLDHDDVKDIILTSKLDSPDFIFGQSDLNFLIIVDGDSHPKSVLKEFRQFIQVNFELSLTIHTNFIPILTESELQTDVIKSYLIRKSHRDVVHWTSILKPKEYRFLMRKQDHYALSFNSIRNLDFYLLRNKNPKSKRVKTKNIYRSISNLKKFHPTSFEINKLWQKKCKRMSNWPILSLLFQRSLDGHHWMCLTTEQPEFPKSAHLDARMYQHKFIKYLRSLLKIEFIEDFILTPSLIQTNPDQYIGKIFIDIIVNKNISKKNYIYQLNNLKLGLRDYETENLKFRIRITSYSLLKLLNEKSLYPFPLEAIYRQKKSLSVKELKYNYDIEKDSIQLASIHFLTTQFMRFRSLQQKTDLIGSRFIKSLNLMFKYHLLSEYLKGNDMVIPNDISTIRSFFTPQFDEIKNDDLVTPAQWKIIKSQLIYLLKDIRDELTKYDSTLKLLRF